MPKQRFYGDADIGKQKAIVARQKLAAINRLVQYEIYNICIDKTNILNICSKYSVIVDSTDNFPIKYLLNDAAIILNKPLVFGHVIDSVGMVSVFNCNGGPSLRCLFPDIPAENKDNNTGNIMSSAILNDITGTIMANEVLKIILNAGTPLNGKLLSFNIEDYSVSFREITKNPKNLEIKSLL